MKIVVVDYGLGNLASVYNALVFLGASAKVSESPGDIEKAEKIILPGVGAFGDCLLGLGERGLREPLMQAISRGKPYLGICLGLQILFERSEEGAAAGLGILKGRVRKFKKDSRIKIPHIGWNTVNFANRQASFELNKGVENDSYFYFDHSYYADPSDKAVVTGITDYGVKFASAVRKDNMYAVQFHPERSQDLGLKILENFLKL